MTTVRITAPASKILQIAEADQETIQGNGSLGDPLRVVASSVDALESNTFDAQYVPAEVIPKVGLVVSGNASGAPTVTLGVSATSQIEQGASPTQQSVGVLISVVPPAPYVSVTVQSGGIVDLPIEVWDDVTGDVGGLIPAQIYYVGETDGEITTIKPSGDGFFVVRVGTALTPRKLLLSQPNIQKTT